MSPSQDPRIAAPSGTAVRMRICAPITGLRRKGHATAALDHQLVYGQMFDVYKTQGRFGWGQEVTKSGQGYVGYIASSALSDRLEKPTHRISVLKAPVFSKPDLKSFIRMYLPLNAQVSSGEIIGDFKRICDGFIHKNHLRAHDDRGDDFVAIAERHLGLPYVWGGVGPDGLDCSGLVQSSLRAVGMDVLRDADMQEKTLGERVVNMDSLQRGDLVFWKGHVGIMRDLNTLLHANGHHMLVVSEPFADAVKRINQSAGPITAIKRFSVGTYPHQ